MTVIGEVALGSLKKNIIKTKNIGFLVEFFARKFNSKNCMLLICNEVLYGSFVVPFAVGYSTPLASIGDLSKATLSFSTEDKKSYGQLEIEKVFIEWKKWYNTSTTKAEARNVVKHSTDNTECAICLEEYKIGEKLFEFDCRHRIHDRCCPQLPILCPYCREGEDDSK